MQIFDIGHAEEGPYYVAELVDGESLAERLRRGPLRVAEARPVAEQLCRALGGAHAQGVVHCDVKPANVLLTADGKVKVGDFGVARLAEGTSQAPSATVAGTPRYMSPEQARGRPTTPATDVYSAGVVLYEMLAGEPPFVDGSAVELGLRHLQDARRRCRPGCRRRCAQVVDAALAKDPAERYRDGAAMAAALRAAEPAVAAAARPGPRRGCPGARREPTHASPATRALSEPPTLDLADTHAAARGTRRRAAAPSRRAPARRGTAARPSRGVALLAALLVLAGRAVAVLLLRGAGASTTVPELRGLPRGGVQARAQRLHVQPGVLGPLLRRRRRDRHRPGPAGGTRTADGSTVDVVLSAGPPPVRYPASSGSPPRPPRASWRARDCATA